MSHAAKRMRRHDEIKGHKPWSPYRPRREEFIGIDGEGHQVLELMAALVDNHKSSETWWEIANTTGLSTATLAKIRKRLTNAPSLPTVMMIFKAFGYEFSIEKKSRR